ncbi:MAG: MCE family protein [Chitinispirillia bacterium]|nr:MCE family protein [Chitinispirillia bacterium]MCL2268038.1 MCE family protein [Chitinispirillia bacterium]
MSDKTLGYILMLSILLLAGTMAGYFAWTNYHPMETLTLRFPQVGSLAVEDPVRMEGTWVGEITGFEHDDSARVVVFIRSPKPIPVRTSSHISVKVKGVMGERFIEITAGNLNDPLLDRSQIIDGFFEMGPSEAIVYMDQLHEKIIELKDIMLWLRDGRDDGKRPFIVAFNDIVGTIDTLVYNLLTGIAGMEYGINDGIDMAMDLTEKTINLTEDVAVKVPEMLESITNLVVKIDEMVPKVEKVFAKIDTLAGKVDDNKLLWGDHAEKIHKSLEDVKKIVDDIRREGLPLNIRLRFF